MPTPLSPSPISALALDALPPYLSNGVLGLRLARSPAPAGHDDGERLRWDRSQRRRRGLRARAIRDQRSTSQLDGVWASAAPDWSASGASATTSRLGELTTAWTFRVGGTTATVEIARVLPTVACPPSPVAMTVRVDRPADLALAAGLDPTDVPGRGDRARPAPGSRAQRGRRRPPALALAGRHLDARHRLRDDFAGDRRCASVQAAHAGRARPVLHDVPVCGREPTGAYRVEPDHAHRFPCLSHARPDEQAGRLAALGAARGFDRLRAENRAAWKELWQGRIEIDGADRRWQAITDASVFYLLSSVHSSSLASTSLFGLAYWPNYHYYHGHVMWDIETFTVPPLLLLAPDAAHALLDYRARHLEPARHNAATPWPARRDVSVGELSAARRGGDAGRAAIHRGPRQRWTSPSPSRATSTPRATSTTRDGSPGPCSGPSPSSSRHGSSRTPRGFEIRGHGRTPRALRAGRQQRLHEHGGGHGAAAAASVCGADRSRRARRPGREIATGSSSRETLGAAAIINHDGATADEDRRAESLRRAAGLFPVGYRGVAGRSSRPRIGTPPSSRRRSTSAPRCSAPCFRSSRPAPASPDLAASSSSAATATSSTSRSWSRTSTRGIAPDRPRASPMFANLSGYLTGLLYGFPAYDSPPATRDLGGTGRPSTGGLEVDHGRTALGSWDARELEARAGGRARLTPL